MPSLSPERPYNWLCSSLLAPNTLCDVWQEDSARRLYLPYSGDVDLGGIMESHWRPPSPLSPTTDEWIKKMWYIYIPWNTTQLKKEWNNIFCSNMDGTESHYLKWSIWETEKQIPHYLFISESWRMGIHGYTEGYNGLLRLRSREGGRKVND